MNAEARFVMPTEDATDDDRWRALEVLSAIPMTIEQLERGNELYSRVRHEAIVPYALRADAPSAQDD